MIIYSIKFMLKKESNSNSMITGLIGHKLHIIQSCDLLIMYHSLDVILDFNQILACNQILAYNQILAFI